MLRRDTYHDYIEDHDIFEASSEWAAKRIVNRVWADLLLRSGAINVSNYVMVQRRDIATITYRMEVRFRSSAWTGR